MILIYTENRDGKFKKSIFELLTYGYDLAQQLNMQVVAVSIGNVENVELEQLSKYGASKIISLNNKNLNNFDNRNYANVFKQLVEKENAKVILFSANNTGKAMAPSLSAKIKAAYVAGVEGLPVSIDPFVVKKKVFTGKAFANLQLKSDLKILSIFQNSYEIKENPQDFNTENLDIEVNESSIKITETQQADDDQVLLSDAEIVVSGGRGMKSADNWEPLEELADILNAATACSRPVSDEGWRPHHEHVGQTGKIIAPNLYIALGISGAIQHYGGISSSKCIVAVNTDKDAPIFENADYGIIGDVKTVIPDMIKVFKELK